MLFGTWRRAKLSGTKFLASQKLENIFAIAKRLAQQTSMAGAGESIFFICLRTMTQSYNSSESTSSFSLMSWGNFSLFFCPNLRKGVLLFAFLKKDGGLRPLLCGSIWHRCAARLTSDCTRDVDHTYFTTTYPNFMQCAGGLQDGVQCAEMRAGA